MVLLTIVGGLMFKSNADDMNITRLVVGILAFYGFFLFLAIVVVPRTVKYFESIKSDELFVLLALGLVFLSAALAEAAGVPAIIGAFFLGMVFAETRLAERIEDRITPFRDALVAVFFIAFGMMIDLSMLRTVVPILLIAVPVTLFYESVVLSSISYLLGFPSKAATFIGTAMTGRSSEAIMYASVGSSSPAVTKGSELNPFAGAFCFIMSMVAPSFMKHSAGFTRALIRLTPKFLVYGGSLINRTMGKVILPSTIRLFERTRRLEALIAVYFIDLVCIMAPAVSLRYTSLRPGRPHRGGNLYDPGERHVLYRAHRELRQPWRRDEGHGAYKPVHLRLRQPQPGDDPLVGRPLPDMVGLLPPHPLDLFRHRALAVNGALSHHPDARPEHRCQASQAPPSERAEALPA